MELVKPAIGLLFWMVLSFGILLFILSKYAWKPILKALKEREFTIEDALNSAKRAKEEMAALTSNNENLIRQAKLERDQILKEARDAKDNIISEAKNRAVSEGNRMISIAKETIQNEKMAAISDLKNQVAQMSIEIAEKILRHELSNDEKQKSLMSNLLKDVTLN
jgi:F-type H+-transporting ATPase subunit b